MEGIEGGDQNKENKHVYSGPLTEVDGSKPLTHVMDPEKGQPEKKAVRIRNLKDEIAAQQDEDAGGLESPPIPKRHKTMSTRRTEQERSMRKTQNMVRNRKRQEAIAKASTPQPKKRKTSKRNNMVDSVVPVEVEHQKVVKKLEGNALDIYMKNYHEFILNQARALGEASEADKAEDEEREKEQKERKDAEIRKKHVSLFTPSLFLLGSAVPHTTRGLPKRSSSSMSGRSISSYFRGRSGRNVKRVEYEWRKIYHERVKNSAYIVTNWPNTNKENSIDLKEASKAKGAKDMKCVECNTYFFVDMKHGHLSCPKCGATTQGGEGVGYQVTFSHQQATQKGAAPYDRLAHVSMRWVIYLFPFFKRFGVVPHVRRIWVPVDSFVFLETRWGVYTLVA